MLNKVLHFIYLSIPWFVIIVSIVVTCILASTGLGWWSTIMLIGVIVGIGMIIDDYYIGMR